VKHTEQRTWRTNGSNSWCRLPRGKRTEIALTYIYGIGRTTATKVCNKIGIPHDRRVQDLNEDELGKLREEIEKAGLQVEGDLRRVEGLNVKRLIEIKLLSRVSVIVAVYQLADNAQKQMLVRVADVNV